ncbi:alpha-L-fucosidase [Eubacteriales bacterium OttesenSCG-928-N13]|nr:alpha-L-fucosidase [Eubacteriales bacterium OttesenSCG-928-N13]
MQTKHYKPEWDSIESHPLPAWYDDAKLGIFIHWGLYSVPAWAEVTWELGGEPSDEEWHAHNPYAEWYLNTLRIEGSPARAHHEKTYGKDFNYEQFADLFTCEKWQPDQWAKLFKQAGAEYVVLTTKHHDGFCLYPSKYTEYNSMNYGAKRDLTGDLAQAVRAEGMKMGTYYSGLFDWTTHPHPRLRHDVYDSYNRTYAFADYSYNQANELVDLYKPSILWNDIGWPDKGQGDLPSLFAHYYNTVAEGLINDRWSVPWCDHTTAEYLTGQRSLEKKWEMCRGLGLSFGYNQNEGDETVMSGEKLVRLLCEFVSHNGNLLINIGPRADGTIPEIQVDRLMKLGAWMQKHGEAIKGTRIWTQKQQDDLGDGRTVFYTVKGNDLYAIIDGLPVGHHALDLPIQNGRVSVDVPDNYPVHVRMEHYFG